MEATYKHISVACVLACIVVAIGWDLVAGLCGHASDSWCQAVRDLNRESNALVCLGWFALTLHLFFIPWLPAAWRQ